MESRARHWIGWTARAFKALFAAALSLAFAQAAFAQTYTNTTSGAINGSTTCTAPLVRNFTVGTNFTVADVDLGVFATHTFRGDIRITLQSPDGTRVQLVNGDADAIGGDNFNVRLDSSAAQVVNTDNANGNHSTTPPPPFANTFRPNNPLSAFGGKASLGTWRLEICDIYPGADDGTFTYGALYLTAAPAQWSDLSLTKTVSTATPALGATITYTLSVTNSTSSPSSATGVTVTDLLPAGVSFVSSSGSYNSSTGVWSVGNLSVGQTKTLTITATVTASAGTTVANVAEVTASSRLDLDSTPGNGVAAEDDYASASFTVQGVRTPGTPPPFNCTSGTTILDWDVTTWASGTLNTSVPVTDIGNVLFAISSTGTWVNNAAYGGLSPSKSTQITGGIVPAQQSLHQYLDFNTQAETATTTITLPTAVPGARFSIYDIDFNAGQFADKIVVTGLYNGATVTPTLTNGRTNYVVGNTAIGDIVNPNDNADGNVIVTFTSPVDTIVISYGNHTTAPANPGGQAMAIHDITFCKPVANLGVTKLSTLISDPIRGTSNPLMIPGAVVEYCILIQNPGSGTATNVVGTDALPTSLTYVANSLFSGTNCASATVAEDDDAAGADESDPHGASISGATITATAGTLGPTAGFALKFRTTVN